MILLQVMYTFVELKEPFITDLHGETGSVLVCNSINTKPTEHCAKFPVVRWWLLLVLHCWLSLCVCTHNNPRTWWPNITSLSLNMAISPGEWWSRGALTDWERVVLAWWWLPLGCRWLTHTHTHTLSYWQSSSLFQSPDAVEELQFIDDGSSNPG